MKIERSAKKLLETIRKSTCAFTTAAYAMERLQEQGFLQLQLHGNWKLVPGGKYYINLYDSGVLAFRVGENADGMLKLVASHTDHPCLYVKPHPELTTGNYGKLNVEVYGGAILNTWLDRPLSVAGRVSLKSDNVFAPRTEVVDLYRPLFTIPNLAIHLNREVNKGIELNKQKDMLPLALMLEQGEESQTFFMDYLAEELAVNVSDILDFELYVYNAEEGCVLGLNNEFLSAPRLDNITSVEACMTGILDVAPADGIHMAVLFDNEEIGSKTKQGADSELLTIVLEKLYLALGKSREEYLNALMSGYFVSLDVAHGLHPNRPEKADPTNKNFLNHGIVLKRAASQTYATDCQAIAIAEQICQKAGIPYQKFASRSDGTTGSTLGTIAGKYLPMRMIDVGVPVLAMHSAREIMGLRDQAYLEEFVKCFFGLPVQNGEQARTF